MKPDERLIIFAHPRSGSSSLYGALVHHPQLRLLDEPFSKKHASWDPTHREHLARITDGPSLDAALDEIFAEFRGLKTLSNQLTRPLNRRMLLAAGRKIVFLRRRNLLRAVVSRYIADQTGLWETWEAKKPVRDYYSQMRPLSLQGVAAGLADMRSTIDYYAGILSHLPPDRYRALFYEDFFLAPAAERQAELDQVFAFLGLDPLPAGVADHVLDPARAQLNSEETFALVPNLREIDEALGSDENGRLFDVR